jgi:hypothetical protein
LLASVNSIFLNLGGKRKAVKERVKSLGEGDVA